MRPHGTRAFARELFRTPDPGLRTGVQVVRHRLQGPDGVDLADEDVGRGFEDDRGVIDERVRPPFDQGVGHVLGAGGWHRDDADLNTQPRHFPGDAAIAHDRHPADRPTDFFGIAIEDRGDPERGRTESAIVRDRVSQTAKAHQGDIPFAIELQDLGDGLFQVEGVIPLTLLAKLAEIGKIPPDLGGGDTDKLGELVGRDIANLGHLQRAQGAHINGKAPDDDIGNVGLEIA